MCAWQIVLDSSDYANVVPNFALNFVQSLLQ